MSSIATLVTNQDFSSRVVLYGLINEDEQFRIHASSVVRCRVKSADGKTTLTPWQVLTHNSRRNDDWDLSTVDIFFPASELTAIPYGNVKLDINVSGPYVARDGTLSSDTYDKTWTTNLHVEVGLA